METTTQDLASRRARRLQASAVFFAAGVMALGGLVLLGWALDHRLLKSVFPAFVAMNPVTAATFVVAGASLWLHLARPLDRAARVGSSLLAAAVLLVAALRLLGYLGVAPGVDELLFTARVEAEPVPNRMAPNTAAAFLLGGAALLGLRDRRPRVVIASQLLVLLVIAIALVTLCGYAYRAESLTRVAGSLPMALHTAGGFVLLAGGILCSRPRAGLLAELTGDHVGSRIARQLLPAAVAAPFFLGWLRAHEEQAGLFDSGTGTGLMVTLWILGFGALLWWQSRALNRSDAKRSAAEAEIAALNRSLERHAREIEALGEASIQRRDAILSAIGRAARSLLWGEDWRDEIETMLERLGSAAVVDRCYLLCHDDGRGGLERGQAEWVGPNVPPRTIGPEDLRSFAELLRGGRPVHGRAGEFSPPMRTRLEGWNVASIAVMPIAIDERHWGTIGFDLCDPGREWSVAELEALRIAADTIGAAIQRGEIRRSLKLRLERLKALRKIDRAISSDMDLRRTLEVVLDQVLRQLDVDAACVLLLNPDRERFEYAAGRGELGPGLRTTPVRWGEGKAGRAALERRSVHIPDRGAAAIEGDREALIPPEMVEYHALPLIAKDKVTGVLEIFGRTITKPDLEYRDYAETLAGQAAIAIENSQLFDRLTQTNADLRLAYETTLDGWSRALDLRDDETQGHTARVATLSVQLGRAMGMTPEEIVHLRRGALLHDIGKMGIPDSILLKPGPLSEEEWEVMRRHPVYAYELLSPIAYLRPALDIPYLHHERWDGSGYPLGLEGEEIPLAARVFAVVDVWDALTSPRPYRTAVAEERVREILREGAGRLYDPQVVEVFLQLDLRQEAAPRKSAVSL